MMAWFRLILLVGFLLSTSVYAADSWLIASKSEALNTGQKISVDVIKPESVSGWPDKLQLKLSSSSASEAVELIFFKTNLANNTRSTYTGVPKVKFVGIVRAELVEQPSNRLLMLANGDDYIAPLQIIATTPSDAAAPEVPSTTKVVLARPDEEPPITANEPLYFLLGYNQENKVDSRLYCSINVTW